MFSQEHKKNLRRLRINNLIIIILQVFILLFGILVWQLLVNYNLINVFIFSSPIEIIKTICNLYKSNNLLRHIWSTIYEIMLSFILGNLLGIIFAIILWSNLFISRILDPYLTILNSLPKIALAPVIIIWFGTKTNAIVITSLLISVITTTLNIYQGFINTPEASLLLLKSLGANKKQCLFELVIPNSYSNIISTLKVNLSLSTIGVIMGEFLVSKQGIGYLIIYGSQVFNLNLVMTGIVLMCLLSGILYYIILYCEKKLLK